MPSIQSLEARTVVVPLTDPVSFSTRHIQERHYTLIRLRDTDGATGIGFCYAGHAGGRTVSMAARDLIGPAMAGQDVNRIRGVWDDTYQTTLLHGRAGSITRAHSAADIAFWDLLARRAGKPLWEQLGAVHNTSVPAYASGGYYRDDPDFSLIVKEMVSYVEAGFTAIKMKTGLLGAERDAARVAAVRAAVGDGVTIMLDANNAWRNVAAAGHALRLLEPSNPYWIEEPFSPDDIESHAQLARRTGMLIATGEIETGRWRHAELLEKRAAAILQTDAAVCGGITEYQRIAALAAGYGVPMAPHWFHQLHVHLVASTTNADWVEYFPNTLVFNFNNLITTETVHNGDGTLALPTTPGLGFDFDDEAVERYAIDDWSQQ